MRTSLTSGPLVIEAATLGSSAIITARSSAETSSLCERGGRFNLARRAMSVSKLCEAGSEFVVGQAVGPDQAHLELILGSLVHEDTFVVAHQQRCFAVDPQRPLGALVVLDGNLPGGPLGDLLEPFHLEPPAVFFPLAVGVERLILQAIEERREQWNGAAAGCRSRIARPGLAGR